MGRLIRCDENNSHMGEKNDLLKCFDVLLTFIATYRPSMLVL